MPWVKAVVPTLFVRTVSSNHPAILASLIGREGERRKSVGLAAWFVARIIHHHHNDMSKVASGQSSRLVYQAGSAEDDRFKEERDGTLECTDCIVTLQPLSLSTRMYLRPLQYKAQQLTNSESNRRTSTTTHLLISQYTNSNPSHHPSQNP